MLYCRCPGGLEAERLSPIGRCDREGRTSRPVVPCRSSVGSDLFTPNLGLREPIESARLKDRRHGLVHLASPRTEPFGRTVATERRDGRENGESPAGRDASREVNHEKEG